MNYQKSKYICHDKDYMQGKNQRLISHKKQVWWYFNQYCQ